MSFLQWVGISLSGVGDYEGNKKKIADAYEIKKSFEVSLSNDALFSMEQPLTHFFTIKNSITLFKFFKTSLLVFFCQPTFIHQFWIWWIPFTGINYVKDGTGKFLLLFSNVLKMMLHLTFQETLFSLLQFTHKVPEVNLSTLLFYHLGTIILVNILFNIGVPSNGTLFRLIYEVIWLQWVWICLNLI